MEEENRETFDSELTQCPDCGAGLVYENTPGIEVGEAGSAQARTVCEDGCGFVGLEEWTLDETVQTDEGGNEEANQETFDCEVIHCPDCGTGVEYDSVPGVELQGEGEGRGRIVCAAVCGFVAIEKWSIEETVRMSEVPS